MWFDLAQTQLVAKSGRRIRPSIGYGFKSARGASPLYGSYVLLAILTALVVAVGLFFWWTAAPAFSVVISFLILQTTLACLLIMRWWQRALAAAWYQSNVPPPVALESVTLETLPPESAIPELPLSQ
jgi:hypothetical protein